MLAGCSLFHLEIVSAPREKSLVTAASNMKHHSEEKCHMYCSFEAKCTQTQRKQTEKKLNDTLKDIFPAQNHFKQTEVDALSMDWKT